MKTNNLIVQFKTATVLVKIIAINVLVFLAIHLISFLFRISSSSLYYWFVLPNDLGKLILKPWSFFTYSFIHVGFFHLLFNMLWLNWFGNYVLNLFTPKRFLIIYLLGAFFGGLLYVIAYNLFPVFEHHDSYLLGASGAIMAIIVFISTYTPNTSIKFFTWQIKLWHIALFLFMVDLVRLPTSGNEGGLFSHIGGTVFGYLYATQLTKGNDIGLWFEKLLDSIANLFKTKKQQPFKKVYKNNTQTKSRVYNSENKAAHQKKIDAILDKIGKSGYESLTKSEKDFLFKAGKE